MPFKSQKPALALSAEVRERLEALTRARGEPFHRVERARVVLAFADGETVSSIARRMRSNRPRVERTINRALQVGVLASLEDLPRSGKPRSVPAEARAWLVSLACQKPRDLGYSLELWTTRLLATHAREHCTASGHPSLRTITRGTVSKILSRAEIRPHKIRYYLERRDPDFDMKMAQVLYVYREVQMLREAEGDVSSIIAILSYDEKPGIQAISNVAPDLPPSPRHPTLSRDHEYVRQGTVSLMAAIDLLSGHVFSRAVDSHNSGEFIALLQGLDQAYPKTAVIRIILDNHSAHISKETRAYLATVPNRFEFVFTPKHGSWLNLIETFFSKMTRTLLRGIRVSDREELKARIRQYIDEVNEAPVVHRWTWGLDDTHVA